MKPTAPLRCKLTHSLPLIRPSACPSMSHRFPRAPFSVLATTPWISSRCPATLMRLKLVPCPHLLAPTLVVLPSMSLGPSLHSLGSRTPAAMLFKHKPGLISFSLGHPAPPKEQRITACWEKGLMNIAGLRSIGFAVLLVLLAGAGCNRPKRASS